MLLFTSLSQGQQNYEQVIPASPTAQTFMRYGEIPVDFSTGVPNINIPIYTLEGSKLSVPISISYHASGIKVNDVASEVGLGWALNAGGVISRTINDIADEAKTGNRNFYDAADFLDWVEATAPTLCQGGSSYCGMVNVESYLDSQYNKEDLMSDRYFYRLPNGSSGVFTYDYTSVNDGAGDVVMLPYRHYKIQRLTSGSFPSKKLTGFKVTDDDGTQYEFVYYLNSSATSRSEWMLKEMVSADRRDTITFHYTEQSAGFVMSRKSNTLFGINMGILGGTETCNASDPQVYSLSYSNSPSPEYGTPVLSSIVSSKAVVNFTYASRTDFTQLKRLDRITISPAGAPSTIIKRIDFEEMYFGSTTADKRLGLDKVVVTNNANPSDPQNQEYTFDYESRMLPPYPTKMSTATFSEDYWGYYNGPSSWYNLIPDDFVPTEDQSSVWSSRDADNGDYAKACMLKAIYYPTGGKTVFEFERNYANSVYLYRTNNGGYYGGFRVKSITNYKDATTVANVKSYGYANEVANPIDQGYFRHDQGYTDIAYPCFRYYYKKLTYSDPVLPLEVAPGLPIVYRTVTEYNGTVSDHAGKTVYQYGMPYYSEYPTIQDDLRYYHPFFNDKGNYVPELLSRTTYSYDGSAYGPLTKDEYTYNKMYSTEYQTGFKITRKTNHIAIPEALGYWNYVYMLNDYINGIVARDSKAIREVSLLTNSKSYAYDPADPAKYVLTSTDYTYNPTNLKVSEQEFTNSESETVKTVYKYPHDFGSQPYLKMIDYGVYGNNMLSPVIEQSTFNNTVLMDRSRTEYKDWGNNVFAPEFLKEQVESGSLDNRVNFVKYNATTGNLEEYKQIDGPTVAYLWGYQDEQYPIAKVENATLAAVMATLTTTELNNLKNGTYSQNQNNMMTILNKIRTGLPNAMVTTYTYSPLIGLTSMTDPKGYTVYYEYDVFNRLRFIKDSNGYIMNQNEYHYKE